MAVVLTGARTRPRAPEVEVEEGGAAGMAQMVGELLREAVAQDPRRAARIRGSIALRASDRDAGVTLRFKPGQVTVGGVADPHARVVIEAPLLLLGSLASGGHGVGALLRGELRARRAARHPLLLARLRRLLLHRARALPSS